MAFPIQTLLIGGALLVLLLLAGYATTQNASLSLPIPFVLGLLTILLPFFTGFSAQPFYGLLRSQAASLARSRPTLYLILFAAFQLILETVIMTLSLTYLIPSTSNTCTNRAQWESLFKNKDETAIRRIQDRFNCCGFAALTDMAWPFPRRGISVSACVEMTRRTTTCSGPWRHAEQVNAGLFFTVASVIFVTQLIAIIAVFTASSDAPNVAWFPSRLIKRLRSSQAEGGRRLLEGSDSVEQHEEYHDDVASSNSNTHTTTRNQNGHRPRIEPSSLVGSGREWRDEEGDAR